MLKLIESNNLPFDVRGVLVRDVKRERPALAREYQFTSSVDDVYQSDAKVIIEVIGGVGIAKNIIDWAILEDRHVITANKALLALHPELLAHPNVRFEAAVCGGIPIIRTLRESLVCRVTGIRGIMNGTCNFVLDEMTRGGLTYAEAVARAQKEGYAEADPSFDVDGKDAFQKLQILTILTFGHTLFDASICQGIGKVTPVDIAYAKEMGCVLRHLCDSRVDGQSQTIALTCLPAVIPEGHDLVVSGPGNVVVVEGDNEVVLKGQGAGGIPTANSVVSDLLSFEKAIPAKPAPPTYDMCDTGGHFFLRFTVMDELGIVATIGALCAELGVNIDSILQHPEDGPKLNFVLTTGWTTLTSMDVLVRNIISKHPWYRSHFLALLVKE